MGRKGKKGHGDATPNPTASTSQPAPQPQATLPSPPTEQPPSIKEPQIQDNGASVSISHSKKGKQKFKPLDVAALEKLSISEDTKTKDVTTEPVISQTSQAAEKEVQLQSSGDVISTSSSKKRKQKSKKVDLAAQSQHIQPQQQPQPQQLHPQQQLQPQQQSHPQQQPHPQQIHPQQQSHPQQFYAQQQPQPQQIHPLPQPQLQGQLPQAISTDKKKTPWGKTSPASEGVIQPAQILEPQPPVVKSKTSEPKKAVGKKPEIKAVPTEATQKPTGQAVEQYGLKIPKRNNPGQKPGRKIKIETNYMPLTISPKYEGVHYDVTIDPEKPKKLFMTIIQQFMKENFPGRFPAYDGVKNLYSHGELPIGPSGIFTNMVTVHEPDRKDPLNFEVTIKFAARIDFTSLSRYMKEGSSQLAPQQAIQCLDVILRYAPLFRFIKVGRSFFSEPKGRIVSLGGGLDMWYGIYQSAILGWKPFINIDIAHKAFPKRQSVVDLCNELLNYDVTRENKPLQRQDFETLKKFIKTLKVEYEIPGQSSSMRTYRVNDVDEIPGNIRFKLDNGKQLTVTEYFATERKYRIKYPHLPCLRVGSRTSDRKICYPCELCIVVPGQVYIRKMDGRQTANMIKESAAPTDIRKSKIMEAFNNMKYNQDPTMKEFGLKVGEKFEVIDARVIDSPTLEYNQSIVKPRDGQWRANRFKMTCALDNWMIVALCRVNPSDVDSMARMLIKNGSQCGMNISYPQISNIRLQDLDKTLRDAATNKSQLTMVIIDEWGGNNYAKVKQAAEIKFGVLTQCIKKVTVERKMNDSTAQQLLLKINAKLNQMNHSIAPICKPPCLKRPCMIIGADVTHPAPGQGGEPSVAAVVASHCPSAFKYNITIRLQPPRAEIIEDLRAMIKEQLMYFYLKTKMNPLHLIMYRDGVSEGQFEMVLNSELMAIRAACTDLQADYKPHISFFVVQKRHHTRFFPTVPSDGDRNKNVPPGTCVDTTITHPTEIDFYLLSHASIRGTARPTRYHCLWDDANMSETEIEELSYYLCYLYTRCNRSVSYPAPTYYAHLAAARAKVFTEGSSIDVDNLMLHKQLLDVKKEVIKENPMFFV